MKFGWVGGSTTGFIQALETLGETKVLAAPRLLVLNKQRAEVHLGDQLGYVTSTQTQTSTTETVNFMPTGTQLRLRPFVSSDGMIRMEIHPERSSGDARKRHPPDECGTGHDQRDGPGRGHDRDRRADRQRSRPTVGRASRC